MQRFNVVHPRERHLIIGPSAGDDETDLVFAGAFEWPVIAGSHMLDNVEWAVMMIARRLDECHAASTLSPEGGTHATSTVLNTGCNLTQERLLRAD